MIPLFTAIGLFVLFIIAQLFRSRAYTNAEWNHRSVKKIFRNMAPVPESKLSETDKLLQALGPLPDLNQLTENTLQTKPNFNTMQNSNLQIASIPSTIGGGKQEPDTIIIHSMAEYIDHVDRDYHAKDWLDKLGLSVHFLICPSGVILQTRNEDQVSWHAKGHNTGSIGVEFLVPGIHTYATFLEAMKRPYLTRQQLNAGVDLCEQLREKGITKITRHDELDPKRKSDPGKGFPWGELLLRSGFD